MLSRVVLSLGLSVSLATSACGGHPAKPSSAGPGAGVPAGKLADPRNETIGGISVGARSEAVEKLLGAPATKGTLQEMAATGDVVADWKWTTGVTLTMAEGVDHVLTVHAITLEAPSKLTTSRGVGIGASRAEVETIYKQFLGVGRQDGEPDTTSPEQLIIGSVYGGTFFQFTAGKVTRIFVGAGAE